MKITPLEIRQKTFEKKMRGYDKDEVNAFLLSLSQEWERVQDQLKELKIKFQSGENEIKQLREVENSLFKTLKTAEDTGANMIDQATKTADLHLRETQMNADALLNEAKSRARTNIENADVKARQILDKMESEIQALTMEYKSLENLRDIIISELRNLSNDTLQRIEKMAANSKKVDVKKETKAVRAQIETMRRNETRQETNAAESEVLDKLPVAEKVVEEKGKPAVSDEDTEESSFFDQIK
jgi:cell division initiation protein